MAKSGKSHHKKVKPIDQRFPEFPAESPAPSSDDDPIRDAVGRVTFTIPATTEGGIAWESVGEKKLSRLRRMAADPEFVRRVFPAGELAPPAPASSSGFDPSICGVFYDALSVLIMGIARLRGMPADRAAVLRVTPQEKELLVGPTATVLQKYVGTFKYQDELMLGVCLLTVINGKLMILQEMKSGAPPAPPGGGSPFPASPHPTDAAATIAA